VAPSLSFPSVDRYLAQLPEGISSYPAMLTKAAIIRTLLRDAPQPLTAGLGLPPRVEALVLAPPSRNDWVSEVEGWAVVLSIYDLNFASKGGLAAFKAWSHEVNARLFRSVVYRVLFSVVSPERLFVGATQRWSAFHRGTVIKDVETSKGRASFRLTTPPFVMPEIGRVGLIKAFQAAIELAGAQGVELNAEAESPTTARFDARWR